MEQIILNLIKLQNQFRVLHWQTKSFAQHKALGDAYDSLDDSIDKLVETHQGKYGRLSFSEPFSIELSNFDDIDIVSVLDEVTEYLTTSFNEEVDNTADSDCLNIRDEILGDLNKLKYLLTLS
jgi:DNA-binding ferritin-like protein